MIQLILFEFKKIFKSKFHILFVILVICYSFYAMTNSVSFYMELYPSELAHLPFQHQKFVTLENEELTSKDVLRYIDAYQHEQAGEGNQAYFEKLMNEKEQLMEKFEMYEIDEEAMKKAYGENYLDIMEAGEQKKMSEEEVLAYIREIEERNCEDHICYMDDPSVELTNEGDLTQFTLKPLYKNKEKVLALNALYANLITYSDKFYERDQYLIEPSFIEKNELNKDIFLGNIPEKTKDQLKEEHLAYFNHKYIENPYTIDSNVANDLLIYTFGFQGPVINQLLFIIVILVLTSNIFSIEKTNQMEQYLACSKSGFKQLTIAKIIAALILAIGFYAIYFIGTVLYISSIVPIRNLDLVSMIGVNYLYTYREVLLMFMALIFTALIAAATLSFFLSCLTKSRFVTILILLTAFFLPYFMKGIEAFIFMPSMMIYGNDYLSFQQSMVGTDLLNVVKIHELVLPLSVFVTGIWLIVCVILYACCYVKQRRHHVR